MIALIVAIQVLSFPYRVTVLCVGCHSDNDVKLKYYTGGVEHREYLKPDRPITIDLSGKSVIEISPAFGEEYGHTLPQLITVDSTATIEIFFSMRAATLTVNSTPSNAEVLLVSGDLRVPIGKTPMVILVPTVSFKLVIEKPGYYAKEIEVNPSLSGEYSVTLVPKNLLRILTSIPASLVINDSKVTQTPYEGIFTPGDYDLKFYVRRTLVSSTKLTVTEDTTPSTLFFDLPNVYNLEIKTDPKTSFVKIGGRTYRTPVSLNLVEGDYDVECWIPGFKGEKKRISLYDDESLKCDLERIYHTLKFSRRVYLIVDGTPIGTNTEFRIPEGIHLLEAFSGERKWIWLKNVDSDSMVFVPDSGGILIVPEHGIVEVDGSRFLSPLAFPLESGIHEIAFRKIGERVFIRKKIEVVDGKVLIFPDEGSRVLFVLSDIPAMRFLVRTSEGVMRLTAPAALKLRGKALIIPLEGCKIEKAYEVEPKDAYSVLKIDTGCGVK